MGGRLPSHLCPVAAHCTLAPFGDRGAPVAALPVAAKQGDLGASCTSDVSMWLAKAKRGLRAGRRSSILEEALLRPDRPPLHVNQAFDRRPSLPDKFDWIIEPQDRRQQLPQRRAGPRGPRSPLVGCILTKWTHPSIHPPTTGFGGVGARLPASASPPRGAFRVRGHHWVIRWTPPPPVVSVACGGSSLPDGCQSIGSLAGEPQAAGVDVSCPFTSGVVP